MMLSLLSSAAPPPLSLSHTLHDIILFYYNKDSPTEHSSDRGGLHMAGGCHKLKCANEKKRKKKRGIRDHHPNNAIFIFFFFFIFDNINKKAAVF